MRRAERAAWSTSRSGGENAATRGPRRARTEGREDALGFARLALRHAPLGSRGAQCRWRCASLDTCCVQARGWRALFGSHDARFGFTRARCDFTPPRFDFTRVRCGSRHARCAACRARFCSRSARQGQRRVRMRLRCAPFRCAPTPCDFVLRRWSCSTRRRCCSSRPID